VTPPAAAASRVAPAGRSSARHSPSRGRAARPAPRPRRLSGPARPRAVPGRVAGGGVALELIALLERLSSHRLLDRLIRGRAWIGLVAFALIGIVALQLALLKLNGGVGRALEHEGLLQRENAALAIENSEMSSATRVQAHAAQLGMAMAPTSRLRFLSAGSRADLGKAAAALSERSRASSTAGEEATAGSAGSSASAEESSSQESSGSSEAAEAGAASESSSSSEGGSSSESSHSSEGSENSEASAPASSTSGSGEASSAGGSAAATGE
jgi:hypothetical protein